MFKSLMCSVDSLILDIFIILGVVVAGALIVYFLWEAVSASTNKNKKDEVELKFEKKPENKKEKVNARENSFVEQYSLDKAEEVQPIDEEKITEVNEVKAEEEKEEAQQEMSEEDREIEERRAYLEAKRQELIRRMNSQLEEEEENETAEETTEESVEETAEEVVEEKPVQKVEDNSDKLEEERNALRVEKAKYETMVRELEAAKRALKEQKAQQAKQQPIIETRYETVVTNGALTLDELREKLAEAEERLKVTEKEFKQCKKEYTPLRRVWTTHEKDEKKLRRKEALVAKQKVILYGVNNYADIDEEKAKKLAEDLDLLDGLKLSVQHCEEVMKKNEERYPLLEKMYNVLSQRNEELKRDIAYYKEEIAKLEAEEDEE